MGKYGERAAHGQHPANGVTLKVRAHGSHLRMKAKVEAHHANGAGRLPR